MSHREFTKWVIFATIHNIDSRERFDGSIARLGVVASSAVGGKLKYEDFDVYRFRPDESKHPRKSKPRKKKIKAHGLDPVVLAAFGNSDPKIEKRK